MHVVRAAAEIANGQVEEAEFSLVEARGLIFSTGIAALEAEVHYASALLSWTEDRHDESLRYLDRLLAVKSGPVAFLGSSLQASYPFPLAYWRGRAYELRGMSEAGKEQFLDQAGFLMKAFEEFERGSVQDRYAEAAMLFNASVLVNDLEVPLLAAYVTKRAENFAWCDATRVFEFGLFHVLGTRHVLEGDHLSALRCFRRSADCSPSVSLRMLAVLDRFRLMREIGETTTAAEELDYALRLAAQTDWERAAALERTAMPTLAELVAPTDVTRARAIFSRYTAIKTPLSRLEVNAHDRRQFADDCYAEAQILRAESEPKRAVLKLIEAFEIWSKVSCVHLRAKAAFELAELTGERRFIEIADDEVRRYPHSSLARRMRASSVATEKAVAVAG